MADKRTITPEEKALLQAKHRQEEAEARNRKKERDARTHRLVQEGAILESIVPHIKEMDLDCKQNIYNLVDNMRKNL